MRTAADRIKSSSLLGSVLVVVTAAGAIGAAPPAYAGVIAQCGQPTCFSDFSIFVGGMDMGGGEFSFDSETGEIALEFTNIMGDGQILRDGNNNPTGIRWMADGAMIDVNGVSGNADPILGFSVATTTGAAGTAVGFVFNLPIALSGPIQASSQVTYSLTSLSSAGAQISQIGTDKIVRSLEVDTSVGGIGSVTKGVDVGDTFSVLGGPTATTAGPYSAVNNFFTGDLAYDLMSVRINYALSANSAVALSGFVQQIVVPLPAALPLLLAGIAAFGAVARRRRLEALPL